MRIFHAQADALHGHPAVWAFDFRPFFGSTADFIPHGTQVFPLAYGHESLGDSAISHWHRCRHGGNNHESSTVVAAAAAAAAAGATTKTGTTPAERYSITSTTPVSHIDVNSSSVRRSYSCGGCMSSKERNKMFS
ncbi:unnamed protein product [Hapterophycus canaliculatus]